MGWFPEASQFFVSGQSYVQDQGLRHAIKNSKAPVRQADDLRIVTMQLLADLLEQRVAAAPATLADCPESYVTNNLAISFVISEIMVRAFEHNLQTDARAKSSAERRELALASLPQPWRPHGLMHSKYLQSQSSSL